jgi:hypothetical protein
MLNEEFEVPVSITHWPTGIAPQFVAQVTVAVVPLPEILEIAKPRSLFVVQAEVVLK